MGTRPVIEQCNAAVSTVRTSGCWVGESRPCSWCVTKMAAMRRLRFGAGQRSVDDAVDAPDIEVMLSPRIRGDPA